MEAICFKRVFCCLLTILCLAACTVDPLTEELPCGDGMVFRASISEEDTKTTLDGGKVLWKKGDEISINGVLYTATPDSDDATNATFKKKNTSNPDPEPIEGKYYAYYPASIYSAGKVVLPSTQTFSNATDISKVAPMYAQSTDDFLSFKNICSLVEVTLTGSTKIKSIEFSSSQGLSGECTIKDGNKAELIKSSANRSVTLDLGSGVILNSGGKKFIVAIPAGNYPDLSVRVRTLGTSTKVSNTNAFNVSVERNKLYHLTLTPSFGSNFISICGSNNLMVAGSGTARVYLDIQTATSVVSSTTLSAVGTNNYTSGDVSISSYGFDSSLGLWYADLAFKSNSLSSAKVCIKAKLGSYSYVTSSEITLSRLKMNVNGVDAVWDGEKYYAITWLTDCGNMPVHIDVGDAAVSFGGRTPNAAGNIVLDLSTAREFTVDNSGQKTTCQLAVVNTGLPVVLIDTPGKVGITSKEEWLDGASIRIFDGQNVDLQLTGTMSIRGRGNVTWDYPKKPYALKFSEKNKVLGMPKNKRWVLLANWKDRTLLRNDAAFWLSRQTSGLEYTPRGYFVELVFNGRHDGNYYLCEQIRVGKNRVNITEIEDPTTSDPSLITGGYLLEIDAYWNDAYKFKTTLFDLPYQLKDPDENVSDAIFTWIQNYIAEMETLIKGENNVPDSRYRDYLDIESAIDYMFVNELATNSDFFNALGTPPKPHSTFLHKDRDGKLYYGPVWDFDYHGFDTRDAIAKAWEGADQVNYYFYYLNFDPVYKARMLEKWSEEKVLFTGLPDYIDQMADYIRVSEGINSQLWPISPIPYSGNDDETLTFQQAVDRIKQGFSIKYAWMDENLKNLGQ